MNCRAIAFLLCIFTIIGNLNAQVRDSVEYVRPVLSSYTFRAGSSHRADTYLSPLRYYGWRLGLEYTRMQAPAFAPDKMIMALDFSVNLDQDHNRAGNASIWGGKIAARWSLMRKAMISPKWHLGLGGATTLTGGAMYLRRNGNNPVAAHGSWTIDVSAYLSFQYNIGRIPAVALYRLNVPLAGVFFAPNYAQLYYQIYMGDMQNNIVGAFPGNYRSISQQIATDIYLGTTALRIGYGFDLLSTHAHGIVSRDISHTLILGITAEWLSISPFRKNSLQSQVIHALY